MAKRENKLDTIRFLIDGAMARNRIDSRKQLCGYILLSEVCLSERIKGKTKWKISDLRQLDAVLGFTEEELATFVRCAY